MNDKLRISVISAVYNAEETIARMIESVINQTYENLELIIIDGGSNDGSLQIINNYKDHVDYCISESDHGIYHAMNKGAREATGDYLYFLNADDWLFDSEVFEKVIRAKGSLDYDLIYGKVVRVYPDFKVEISRDFSSSFLARGKIPPHQASFFSKDVFWSLDGYQERYQSAGDLDLFCRLERISSSSKFVNVPVAFVRSGGVSSQKEISTPEVFHVINDFYGNLPAAKFQIRMVMEKSLKSILKNVRLQKLYKKILMYKLREDV